MYVRDAKNRDEVWMLDHIEEMSLDDASFRSRDYVIAVDEETGDRAGFGRLRVHATDDGEVCELTSIGVLEPWRGQGVGAHVVERLVEKAGDLGFDTVYAATDAVDYLSQFGFEAVDRSGLPPRMADRLELTREARRPNAVGVALDVDAFSMPERLRERFKHATPTTDPDAEPSESAEDFGIDPDRATYKYDTGQ